MEIDSKNKELYPLSITFTIRNFKNNFVKGLEAINCPKYARPLFENKNNEEDILIPDKIDLKFK